MRQSRHSPARDLEQPRPLGFTVTGQTLDQGEGSRGKDRAGTFISKKELVVLFFILLKNVNYFMSNSLSQG